MAYVTPNFKTKKALREALLAKQPVSVYMPGLGTVPHFGMVFLEGPHFPEAHRWYAEGTMHDGKLTRIK